MILNLRQKYAEKAKIELQKIFKDKNLDSILNLVKDNTDKIY